MMIGHCSFCTPKLQIKSTGDNHFLKANQYQALAAWQAVRIRLLWVQSPQVIFHRAEAKSESARLRPISTVQPNIAMCQRQTPMILISETKYAVSEV
jgi:hypothetical protein